MAAHNLQSHYIVQLMYMFKGTGDCSCSAQCAQSILNYSQGKIFLYLFFALLSSAITVDEFVFLSMDCMQRK